MARPILIVSVSILHAGRDPRTIRAERLIAGLAARGHAVDVVSLWSGGGEPEPVAGARQVHAIEAPIDWDAAGGEAGPSEAEARALGAWAQRARSRIASLPSAERPGLVYAIGVPASALAAGAAIAESVRAPLILDLGDPWPAASGAERERRRRTLAAASALISTTPELLAELRPPLPPGTPTLLAPAGGELRRRAPRPDGAPPLFVHLGAINAGRVDPEPAYEALARLDREGRIELRSHSNGWHPRLGDLSHPHLPLLPHPAAIELLASAAGALVLGNRNRAQLPSKAYEIACTETWALCVSELSDDPAAAVLERTGHAVRPAANEAEAIAAAAEEILAREARGERPSPAAEYSWERRIDEIAALVEGLGGHRAGPS